MVRDRLGSYAKKPKEGERAFASLKFFTPVVMAKMGNLTLLLVLIMMEEDSEEGSSLFGGKVEKVQQNHDLRLVDRDQFLVHHLHRCGGRLKSWMIACSSCGTIFSLLRSKKIYHKTIGNGQGTTLLPFTFLGRSRRKSNKSEWVHYPLGTWTTSPPLWRRSGQENGTYVSTPAAHPKVFLMERYRGRKLDNKGQDPGLNLIHGSLEGGEKGESLETGRMQEANPRWDEEGRVGGREEGEGGGGVLTGKKREGVVVRYLYLG